MLALTINMVRPGKRFGYQEVIDRFYSDTGLAQQDQANGSPKPPDQGGFCRARKKLPREVFEEVFGRAVDEATDRAGSLEPCRWHGYRVYAIDGTKKNMPCSDELAQHYGVPYAAHYPQMLVCTLYDVLAKIPINGMWGPYRASERTMAQSLYEELGAGDLLLMDRGFPSFEVLWDMVERNFDFLVRLPKTGMFGEVAAFLSQGHRDGLVTIAPPAELVREQRAAGQPIPKPLTLRVVKIASRKKGTEAGVFITTLLDKKEFSIPVLRDLYHLRWEEEEYYKLVKGLLEAENFRGKSCLLIDQEVIAMYLYCVLVRIMMLECAEQHDISPNRIAQQHAFLAVTRYLDRILVAKTIDECTHLLFLCIDEISWRLYKKRPNRSYPRRSKTSYGKWGRKAA
jgi:hypothetical protein